MHRELRVVTACPVAFSRQGELVLGESEDLSLRGVFVRTDQLLAPGAVVTLNITLPEGRVVAVVARVAHQLSPSAARALGRSGGMGFEFLEHESDGREQLTQYLEPYLAEPPPVRRRAETLPQVLIVDDDPAELARLSVILQADGFGVRLAASGALAYASAIEHPPDVLLVAADMAGMDGWTLVETLMGRSVLHLIPIVLMVEETADIARLKSQRVGIADFIRRPFEDEELRARMHRIVSADRATAGRVVLSGSVQEIGLRTLLSLMEFERKSGVLTISQGERVARLYLAGGRIVKIDGPTGDNREPVTRLMDVLGWDSGSFELSVCEVVGEDQIEMKTSVLLLEHARIVDEKIQR